MRRNIRQSGLMLCAGTLLSLVFSSTYLNAGLAQQVSVANPPNVAGFNDHINQYMALHEAAAKKVPRPGKESKPDKIEMYQEGLADLIRGSRVNARQGDVFSPEIASQFKQIIKTELKGPGLKETKTEANSPEVKGVPMRVNYPYPVSYTH